MQAHHLEAPIDSRLLDLVSEVGELAKEVLTSTHYGRDPFRPSEGWPIEVGDAFYSLICLANGTGVNLETALADVLDKYRQRLDHTGGAGSGR